eukprot:3089739-Pleurochrysis_carterae.AAC.1
MNSGNTWNYTAAPLTVRSPMSYMLACPAENTRDYAFWAVDRSGSRTLNYFRKLFADFSLTRESG